MPFKALFSSVFAGRLQMELRDEKIRKQCGGRLKNHRHAVFLSRLLVCELLFFT